LGPRRATWPRKRRRQRKQRRQPKRKRSNRSTKPLSRIALTSVTPIAARTGRSFSRQNIRATNSQAGPSCRWLLHNGSVFHWN
jgi:hypothetical protein